MVGATIGATILFLVVNTSFGSTLAEKAGPFVAKLRDGFQENALSYLLFLRLVPAFPFFIVNLVPALLGVPLRTFVIGTGLGIIPGTIAYSLAGSGLGSVIEAQNATYKTCLAGQARPMPPPAPTRSTSRRSSRASWSGPASRSASSPLFPSPSNIWSKRHAAA